MSLVTSLTNTTRSAPVLPWPVSFPNLNFFNPARDGALALESTVQQIEQLSTLAIDMPELLPRIIKIAEARDAALSIEETRNNPGKMANATLSAIRS